jgi:DNA (cytosine-5)-methyltransferase 1
MNAHLHETAERLAPRPRLLDLFSGAGGSAVGYHRAGFEVVGVDIAEQPHYPFEFIRADALEFLDQVIVQRSTAFAAIHASPPCQAYSAYRRRGSGVGDRYPDLIAAMRVRLVRSGVSWVIENVPGAPLRDPVQLCGSGLGLDVRRHRLFETSFSLLGAGCVHGWQRPRFAQATNRRNRRKTVEIGVWRIPLDVQQRAMGIDWMTLEELSEAVPPAMTEHIGTFLRLHLDHAARERDHALQGGGL